jgi:hypothetical protein
MREVKILPTLCLIVFLLSCNNSNSISLSREDLFFLNLGKMDNQFDFFVNTRSPLPFKNNIFFDNGIFYITNGSAAKCMEFTLFGELTLLLYNPVKNPLPVLLKNAGTEKKEYDIVTRRAIETPFSDIGALGVDGNKNLYIEDRITEEKGNTAEGSPYQKIIKRFDRFGNFIDSYGRTGKGGLPFPAIENFYLTNQNEMVVVCRTDKGDTVYWLNADGLLLYEAQFDSQRLPVPKDLAYIPTLGKIVPDYNAQRLYIMISYYSNVIDESTRLMSKVIYRESRIYTFDLAKEKYEKQYITIPAEGGENNDPLFTKGKPETPIPYDFLGISERGYFYLLKMKNKTTFELVVFDTNGKAVKNIRIFIDDTDVIAINFNIAKTGLLYALISENTCARIVLWRSDKAVLGST